MKILKSLVNFVNVEGNSFSIDFTIDQNNLSPCQDAWIQGGQLYFSAGMIVNIGDFIAYNGIIYYNYQFDNFPLTAGKPYKRKTY